MSAFLNPRSSPGMILSVALLLSGSGILLSATRLKTVAAEKQSNDIAQYRATICRILPADEQVVLGAYYFQPIEMRDGQMSGPLAGEGIYICDSYGKSARIERGGYAQFVVTATDVSAFNRTLKKRLEDKSNPDHAEMSRIRRAVNKGLYKEPGTDEAPPRFFDLTTSTNEG